MKILGQIETHRLGRAVEALLSGQYRWRQVVAMEGAMVRGYVQRMDGGKLHSEYAVQVATDGSQGWCSCRDHFVGGHTCEHIAIAVLVMAQQAAEAQQADNRSRGVQRPKVVGA